MRIEYPAELPVSARRDDIAAAIRDHQVVIVAGATGSGKTTQLPKICLELGRERIGHTQPRRIAARTIAERIADELGEEVGQTVGFTVRFDDRVSAESKLKVMTDGILLAEMHRDRDLAAYDTIIIDEAHERSLTIDFLIGYLKGLLPRRPDLKVIITSATIDPESFSKHFDDAPIIEVSGRTFPVDIRYRPLVREASEADDEDAHDDQDPIDGIADALAELEREDPGDVLVFFAGEADIRDAREALAGRLAPGTEILPLYGRLSSHEQHRVFDRRTPGIRRRIVLATNVAETSLTVPGIRHVVDTGTARISRYSVRSKVQRLPIEAISQASANQRSGRAGRVAPGVAIRLYSEEDFARRPEFTDPEILRTNLAAVILQAATLGLGPLEWFPFLQPPDSRGLADGLALLRELGAVRADGTITKLGRELSRLPVDPRFGRMVLAGRDAGVAHEVIAIVAGLTIQDPRERPLERRAHADQLHARFVDPKSDFLTLLALWRYLQEQRDALSSSAFRRLCKAEMLNFVRVREWHDVVRQLTRAMRLPAERRRTADGPGADGDAIHKALLAGLLSHIGIQAPQPRDKRDREYLGARGTRFRIFPGSGLAKSQPRAVMAAELVETSRLFARTVAAIDPAWAEPLAGDLAKRQRSEPHWEKQQGAAVAYERVTLFGVPIVERRRVQLARFDREHARELFIRHALVDGEWDARLPFDRANRALRREIEQQEERQRRRDLLVDDDVIADFYDARIPAEVVSTRSFEEWWRTAKLETPELLTMTRELLLGDAGEVDDVAFPAQWRQGDQRLRLSYRFEPGADDDGVTVHVPVSVLPRLSPAGFDWLVPGLRDELVVAMIRALPKHIRKHVVPAADWARGFLAELPAEPTDEPLTAVLAHRIQRTAHVTASASDVDASRIPAHLTPRFQVEGERGTRLGAGRDLVALQRRFARSARERVAAAVHHDLEATGVPGFVRDLPEHVDVRQGGNTVRAYPGYAPGKGGSIDIRLQTTAEVRDALQRAAVRRMVADAVASPASYVQDSLTAAERLALATSPYPSTPRLFDDILLAIVDAEIGDARVATVREFERVRDAVSRGIVERMVQVASLVARILTAQRGADKAIREGASIAVMAQLADAREQLGALVHDGFVSGMGLVRLPRLVTYVQAIEHRVRRLGESAHRDAAWMREVEAATEALRAAGGSIPLAADAPARVVEARWLIEELRVSLFAQPLGAAPVSLQRIRKLLA